MENGPQDPRKHPFWYSAYQAGCGASWIIKAHIAMYRRQPDLISRVPAFWSASFSAAVSRSFSFLLEPFVVTLV